MVELPVVCTLNENELQRRRQEILARVKALVRGVDGLESGVALSFDGSDATLEQLTRMIQLERACCRFLRFALTAEPDGGALRLEITGPAGTRDFLEREMSAQST